MPPLANLDRGQITNDVSIAEGSGPSTLNWVCRESVGRAGDPADATAAYFSADNTCGGGRFLWLKCRNVHNATVVNGQLVVGAPIPAPCTPLRCTPPDTTLPRSVPAMSEWWLAFPALEKLAIEVPAIQRSRARIRPDLPAPRSGLSPRRG